MRGRLLVGAFVVGLAAVGVAAAAFNGKWSDHLSGGQEVPANASQGQGQAIFRLSDDGLSLDYKLIASNIDNVVVSHIHLAPLGVNGPVVVFLYGPVAAGGGRQTGVLATGTITAANLTGPLAGHPLADLVTAMRRDGTYVQRSHERRRRPRWHRPWRPTRSARSARRSSSSATAGRGAHAAPRTLRSWATGTRSASRSASVSRPGSCSRGSSPPGATACCVSTLGALAIGAVAGLLVKGWIGLPRRARRRPDRRRLGLDRRPRRAAPRRHHRRHRVPRGERLDLHCHARVDPARRVRDRRGRAGGRRAPRAAGARAPRRAPLARPVSAREARPRPDRRPHADHAGRVAGDRDGADAHGARGARDARARDDDLSRRSRLSASPRSRPARTPTSTRSRTSSGGTGDERRLVEYGSSFGAARAAGLGRTLRDTLVGMNAEHLGRSAVTLFEALADAGLATAAVNFTAYRGRTPHRANVPFLGTVRGPERFYFYNLFQSRADRCAALLPEARGRHRRRLRRRRRPVARDPRRLRLPPLLPLRLRLRLACGRARRGPAVLARCDEAVGGLVRAAGGLDAFVERYAVIVMSDHGQSSVREVARLGDRFRHADETLVAASNRAGHVYRLGPSAPTARELAERLDGDPSVEVALFREGDAVVARREGEEPRIADARAGRVPRRRRVDPRPARRRRARGRRGRLPERGRGARLGPRRLGVSRPRGRASPRRWLARLPHRRGLARARADGRPRAARSARASWTSRRSSSTTSAWRHRPTSCAGRHDRRVGRPCRGAPVADGRQPAPAPRHRGRARPRRDGARAARGVRPAGARSRTPTTTRPSRSARARRSRSRTSWPRCARSSPSTAPSACSTSAPGSGYGAAVLDELAASVVSIERLEVLAGRARAALDVTGHGSVERAGRRRDASERPTGRRSTRSPSPPRPIASRRLSTTSSPPAAASSCRAAARAAAARPRRPHRGGRRRDGLARLPLRPARRAIRRPLPPAPAPGRGPGFALRSPAEWTSPR